MKSIGKFSLLVFAGSEIFYLILQEYGRILTLKERDLHHALFELIPGFVWGDMMSMIWGALVFGCVITAVGTYVAWAYSFSFHKKHE